MRHAALNSSRLSFAISSRQFRHATTDGHRLPELKLDFDITPVALRNKTLRKLLPRSRWEVLRRPVVERCAGLCEACGGPAKPVFVHEVWQYADARHHRTLIALRGLCRDCSDATHLLNTRQSSGRSAAMRARGPEHDYMGEDWSDYFRLLDHWCHVNGVTTEEGNRMFIDATSGLRWKVGEPPPKWTQDWGVFAQGAP